MHSELNVQLAFRLTGMRSAGQLEGVEALALRPALLAGYRDLTKLRYDFPLVLGSEIRPLSQLVDEALAGNSDGELRYKALAREREIRALLAGGGKGRLSDLWNPNLEIRTDGELADCDAALPRRFVEHAWSGVQAKKAQRFRERADKLALQLAGILAADYVHSDEGRSAEKLAAALAARDDSFDTKLMSRLLSKAVPERRLPESRRKRIRSLLATIKEQRFFAEKNAYSYVFENCTDALHALTERRPKLIELGSAMAAAELEAAGEYDEARHDPLFEVFGEVALDSELCPDYLVCLNARELHARENAGLQLLLASGMPVKVLVQHDDILERTPLQGLAFGTKAQLLAGMALGLNNVYVVQSSASNLYPLAEKILKGIQYRGVALFSVFTGATGQSDGLPPYLVAAAAMESRAFPAFSYDPSAGDDYGKRFSLENNPQPEADWPQHEFSYEDAEHQRMSEKLAFTLTDFAAADRRYASFFARVSDGEDARFMVDGHDKLQKVIAADPVLREAQRCLENWHHLQSFVARKAAPAPAVREVTPVEKPAAAPAPAGAEEVKKAPASDEPYIETPRCTTCEECMKINNKLFVYDSNKQAYIADPKLGSYKDLVEAAENCQVSIIHPGKPLNPDEPGLDELVKRAEPFL